MQRRHPQIPALFVGFAVLVGLLLPRLIEQFGSRNVFFALAGVFLVWFTAKNQSYGAVAVAGCYVLSGVVRRIFPAPDATADPAALIPLLVAIPFAVKGIRLRLRPSVLVLVAWVTVLALLTLSNPLTRLAGWLDFVVPILAGIGIGTLVQERFLRSLAGFSLIAGAYGIWQYVHTPTWDSRWLVRAQFRSAGTPGESTFRPFSTLASPGTAAFLAAIVVLVLVTRPTLLRPLWRWAAVGLCAILMLLTQVRTMWLALFIALVVVLLTGQRQVRFRIVLLTFTFIVVLIGLPQRGLVLDRVGTLGDLSQDRSFQSRAALVDNAGQYLSPLGRGVGSLSAGSRAEGGAAVDNGYLVIVGEIGLVGLTLFTWLFVDLVRRTSRTSWPFLAMFFALNVGGFAFGGLGGIAFWSIVGSCMTASAQNDRRSGSPPARIDAADTTAGGLKGPESR